MTRVPPVTALRSPPLSRTTGALSPVIALSSTEAIPSTTSPSAGIISPAFTINRSPIFSSEAGSSSVILSRLLVSRLAITLVRLFLSSAAFAFPCPSAIASAKFANSTVNHSQIATPKIKVGDSSVSPESDLNHNNVVSKLPRYTANITGLRI